MKPNEMTLEDAIDWLLRDIGWVCATAGWHPAEAVDGTVYQIRALADDPVYYRPGADNASRNHPIPPTIDSIAAAMPEGWVWMRGMWDGRPQWVATRAGTPWVQGVSVPDTGDEKLDRARLAVACRRAASNA